MAEPSKTKSETQKPEIDRHNRVDRAELFEPARSSNAALPYEGVYALQDAAGNHAVEKFLDSDNNQPTLASSVSRVSQPEAPYEQEADRIAQAVVSEPEPDTDQTTEANQAIQSDSGAETSSAGQPLSTATRNFFEQRFGHDFSRVRVHHDQQSTQTARQLGADAFTTGRHIHFNASHFTPDTTSGKRLLAHELTHVIQQGQSVSGRTGQPEASSNQITPQLAAPSGVALRKETEDPPKLTEILDFEAIAGQVHKGIAGLGTDEEGVYLALEKLQRNPEAIERLKEKYKEKYGVTLEADIRDDFSGTELEYALQLINMGKTGANQAVAAPPTGEADWNKAADRLRAAVQGAGTDEEAIYAVMLPLNRQGDLIAKLKSTYASKFNEDMRDRIVDEMSGNELEHALYLLGEGPRGMDAKYALDFVEKALAEPVVQPSAAKDILAAYRALSAGDRRRIFGRHFSTGKISQLLKSLSAEDANRFPNQVRELLRWLEEAETRKASGLTDDEMAELQAKFAFAKAQAEAKKELESKTPEGEKAPEPTPQQVEKKRQEHVEKTSIAPTKKTTWDTMGKDERKDWEKKGQEVIQLVLAHVKKNHPELHLSEKNFLADFAAVEKRGQSVLAHGGTASDGTRQAVFGFRFVEAAKVNPAYVMSIVVHEVFGHPEYGPYGSEYHLSIYDKASAKTPGYKKPDESSEEGQKARRIEEDAFGYQETEIYSLLRSLPYHTSIDPKDKAKNLVSIDPADMVKRRLKLMKRQWEPKLVQSLVRGLLQRLRHDPRITPEAVQAFEDGVVDAFTKDEAAEILK